jgi:hypothetical protein
MDRFEIVPWKPGDPTEPPAGVTVTRYGKPVEIAVREPTPAEQERIAEMGRRVMREYLRQHPELWRLY